MNLGELFVEIGIKGNPEKLEEFNKKVDKFVHGSEEATQKTQQLVEAFKKTWKQIAILGAAIAGAYWAMDRLTASLTKQNLAMLNLARTSSVALETYQKWATIGKIAGVSGIEQQIRALDQRIFNLRLTGEGARGFQLAGILPTNAEDVLNQLRNRISGMNNTAASYLLEQMGLSPEMITLLKMGREEWEQYLEVQRKFTLTREQRKEIDRMNRQLEVAKIKLQYLKDSLLLALLPIFLKITQALATLSTGLSKFVNWLNTSNSVGAGFIKFLIGGVALATTFSLIMLKLPLLIKGVTLALGVLRNALRLSTLGISLLIEGLILLIDDLYNYYTGGDSVIGLLQNLAQNGGINNYIESRNQKNLENDREQNNANLGLNPWKWAYHAGNVVADKFIRKNNYDSIMTPAGKTVTYTTTNNQSIPVNQTNYIYTNEAASTVNNNLRYAQGMVLAPQ